MSKRAARKIVQPELHTVALIYLTYGPLDRLTCFEQMIFLILPTQLQAITLTAIYKYIYTI